MCEAWRSTSPAFMLGCRTSFTARAQAGERLESEGMPNALRNELRISVPLLRPLTNTIRLRVVTCRRTHGSMQVHTWLSACGRHPLGQVVHTAQGGTHKCRAQSAQRGGSRW